MYVEKYWDDLWLGVKGQSNLEIAVLQNLIEQSIQCDFVRVRAVDKHWGLS